MSSRQPLTAEVSQELEEDAVSGTGEGDEIMEEPEEQEDGYSAYISILIPNTSVPYHLYTILTMRKIL